MTHFPAKYCCLCCFLAVAGAADLHAQKPPYDVFPPAEPPYYRVRYEASSKPGELVFPVNYTIWIPQGVKTVRGVIVHQHGCGEGSCKSGLTGAYDLHWQALARKHDCALLSPSYEQPEKEDCQMWCDPRNGSDAAFQKGLADLGAKAGHPELAKVPWALWGHSGGGHWAGGMVLLHPDRVVAAWLRSGVPLLKPDPQHPTIKAHTLPEAALQVPVMCNLGTKEGVTVTNDRFAGVWPANEAFFNEVRGKGGLVGVAVDPLTSHECGNQRYFAIPWLDACLSARLPKAAKDPLPTMPTDQTWLAAVPGGEAVPAAKYPGEHLKASWLPNEAIARAWMEYVKDTKVSDTTPPPVPREVRAQGNMLTWEAEADLESGLASFVIERDGQFLANLPEQGQNPFGRPIFQNLQYSDTPTQPLATMQFNDTTAQSSQKHTYRVMAVNTVGLKSNPSAEATPTAEETSARVVPSHGYTQAIELQRGKTRAVLCPQAGGRVLEFSVDGTDAMYFEEAEKNWKPGKPGPISADRFDYGPELVVAPHPKAWAGEWAVEITKANSVKLTSAHEDAGIQLVREFRLVEHDRFVGLSCRQTMVNVSQETREVCHWGRSFSPGGGICVIPLGDRPSRFPGKYAMYEDSAVINVKATDDHIRGRDGFLEILAPPRKPKLGFDSYAGWLGYVLPNDTLFVKRFPTYPDRVYNEAAGLTLSVWYPSGPRIELEPIGPRERLKPGESASFIEEWWLLSHPFPKEGQQLDLKALAEQVEKQTAQIK
jgi:hypothetical protein